MCYWDRIYQTFLDLVGGNYQHLRLIDGLTVRLIQSRVPKVSPRDFRFLESELGQGNLFRTIPAHDRQAVWERLINIDFPIPSLETFFKDRLYLEVGRSVMQQVFLPDPNRKVTIDERVYEHFDTHIPLTTSYRHEALKSDLWEFWRFSFQYGFEMTEHRRRVSPSREEGHARPTTSQPSTEQRALLWQHFFRLVRQRGYRVHERLGISANLPQDLPPLPHIQPVFPETDMEIPVKRRSGKPYTDSIDADRFALSAEALQQAWTFPRVTAGFLRQSVFFMFFFYLTGSRNGPGVRMWPEGTQGPAVVTSLGVEGSTAEPTPRFAAAEPVNTPLPDAPSDLLIQQPQPTVPTIGQSILVPESFVIDVSLDDTTYEIQLPQDPDILTEFFNGLGRNYFHISNPAEHGRGMSTDDCCRYYREHPDGRLHAIIMSRPYLPYSQSMQEPGTGRPVVETTELQEATEWLQDAIATLGRLRAAAPGTGQPSSDEDWSSES